MTNLVNWMTGKNIEDKNDRVMHYAIMAWTVLSSVIGIIAMTAEYLGYMI